jgi:uncharacterized membrane protein
MIRYLCTYAATFIVMLAMDAAWLTLTVRPLYRANLGDMLLEGYRPLPAILFYALYIVGVMVFVVPADDAPRNFARIALFGGLFGLFCYATYDLTNLATLRIWSVTVTVADMAWGAALTAAGSTLGTLIGDWLTGRLRG